MEILAALGRPNNPTLSLIFGVAFAGMLVRKAVRLKSRYLAARNHADANGTAPPAWPLPELGSYLGGFGFASVFILNAYAHRIPDQTAFPICYGCFALIVLCNAWRISRDRRRRGSDLRAYSAAP